MADEIDDRIFMALMSEFRERGISISMEVTGAIVHGLRRRLREDNLIFALSTSELLRRGEESVTTGKVR